MGALLPTEHQEEFHRQSSAGATLKSTLPKQGRDDLEVFFKQTSFLVLMLKKNVLNHPALFWGQSSACGLDRRSQNASAGNRARVTSMATMYSATRPLMLC